MFPISVKSFLIYPNRWWKTPKSHLTLSSPSSLKAKPFPSPSVSYPKSCLHQTSLLPLPLPQAKSPSSVFWATFLVLTTSPPPSPNHCPHGNLVANFLHTYRSKYFKHPVTSWRSDICTLLQTWLVPISSSLLLSTSGHHMCCPCVHDTLPSPLPLLVIHATSRSQAPIRSPFHGSHSILIFHICHVAHLSS